MARKPNAAPPRLEDDTIDPNVVEDELIVTGDETDLNGTDPNVVEESVDSLREQLDAANARAEREAAARVEAEKRSDNAGRAVADSNLQAIDNAISSSIADKKNLLAEITAAKEAGDYAKEADALDRLQTTNIKIARLGEGKSELERRIEQARDMEEINADPLEGYIANARLNGQAATFMRQHPDIILTNGQVDRSKLGELEAAHYLAVGARNKLVAGTQEYFDFLENELITGGNEPEERNTPAPKPNGSRQPPAARPSRTPDVSRSVQARNLPSGVELRADGTYRMSAERRDAARISGMSDAEYLKNVLALQRENQLH